MKEVLPDNYSSIPVDLVYLWVNGNDSEWKERKSKFTGIEYKDTGKDCKGRYSDNDELRHNLRAVEKYAPWIRNIFIVTDCKPPQWLDTSNPKIKIIDQNILLAPESIPCFNSVIIEHRLHLIPGLSEYFLYANDDMFLNKEVSFNDFFTKDLKPIVRLNRRFFRKFWVNHRLNSKKHPLDNYNLTIHRAASLVKNKLGRYIGHKPHHNIDSFKKSDYEETYRLFKSEIESTFNNHLRSDSDIQRAIYVFTVILQGKAKMKLVNDKTSFRCHIEKAHYFDDIEKKNPLFFCLNDSQFATDDDRKRVSEFLEKKFPEKSQFEK